MVLGGVPLLPAQNAGRPTEKGALIRSLVVPGWGQHVLGDQTSARRFMMVEAGLWLSYFVTNGAADWYQQDYRAFAALHAGADYRQKPDNIYYVRVGHFDSITEYNQAQLRQRNPVYPLGTGLDWQWDQPANREHYVDLRHTSLRVAKAASFVLGGMVVNRALAAIHVLLLSRLERSPAAYGMPFPDGGGITFTIQL